VRSGKKWGGRENRKYTIGFEKYQQGKLVVRSRIVPHGHLRVGNRVELNSFEGLNNFIMEISGKIVDVIQRKIFPGKIMIGNGRIKRVIPAKKVPEQFILPGCIDAHVHIESSMLTPQQFARLAIRQGTVGVVTDPHEIANVLGVEGIRYMMKDAEKTPMKIKFGIPSCVPATSFETSGAVVGAEEIEIMFKEREDLHLAEMMNYPGVIYDDPEVMKKIAVARKYHRIIDGHAPGVRGKELKKYIDAGITTDHECSDLAEAEEKIHGGMKILIREGSAAKNFETLMPLIDTYPEELMFCTDDSHPDDLAEKHILDMVRRAVNKGYNLWNVLRVATVNPVRFYGLRVGLLQPGDEADFIICNNLKQWKLLAVFLGGQKVFDGVHVLTEKMESPVVNRFDASPVREEDIRVKAIPDKNIRVIMAQEGNLLTGEKIEMPLVKNGLVVSDPGRDILKIVVMNRYNEKVPPEVGFISGFGLQHGALASSIAHDSHNLIAIGTDDREIVHALNGVIREKGGIAVSRGDNIMVLPLPVAGLMSVEEGGIVVKKYQDINNIAKLTGTSLRAPFMTLSFMALLVIPELKIGDRGLFDVRKFGFTDLFV